jgi:hypothetical protein
MDTNKIKNLGIITLTALTLTLFLTLSPSSFAKNGATPNLPKAAATHPQESPQGTETLRIAP